jgi:uncharacterized protein YegL
MNTMSDEQSEQLASFMVPGGNYGYTGAAIDTLQSFENTIALGLVDESGSTSSFAKQLESCVKEIVGSLRDNPNADKLLYAHYHFDTNFREVHGFTELNSINPADYDGCWAGGGRTTLYDSESKVVKFVGDYGKQMAAQRYLCNGIIYVLTDGMDWGSVQTPEAVKDALAAVITGEEMESLMTILIGINDDPGVQQGLKDHADEVGFTQYIPAGKADKKTLSKIAGFISQSISSQSQALGSGGPSQSLTF